VDTVNDGPAAQAMSTDAMANLYASIEAGSLAGGDGAGRMHGLLEEAAGGDEPSWLLRSEIAPPDAGFLVQATKIGLGPLKAANGGFDVCSEGSVLVDRGTDRRFIAVWQNCPHASRAVVPFVIDRAIKLFVAAP
jgi:hypothetical protein